MYVHELHVLYKNINNYIESALIAKKSRTISLNGVLSRPLRLKRKLICSTKPYSS